MLVSEIGNICYEEGGVGINKFARIVSLVMLFEKSEENKWATSKGQEIDLLISKIGKFCCGDGGGVLLVLLFKQSEENEWVVLRRLSQPTASSAEPAKIFNRANVTRLT